MRAPVSRSRPLSRCCGLPVADHPHVGRFRLGGELLLGRAHGEIDREDPGGGRVAAFGAGDQFELAQLFGGKWTVARVRSSRRGVSRHQKQARELPRGGRRSRRYSRGGARIRW